MRLALVAASGLALEALAAARAAGRLEDVVVLDDDPARWGGSLAGARVVGGLDELRHLPGHQVVVCAGRGAVRARIVERLATLGVGPDRYAHVVHPSVSLPGDCSVGAGTVLLAGAVLTAEVRIGRHVVVMPNAVLTHEVVLDDFTTICAGVALGGRVQVGRSAYLGMNSSIREDVRVGAGATLGMGAALTVDLPAEQTWVGVPARPLGHARKAIA